ncbi:hypothetical protein TNCV_763521 [Trichonephila clavipes]|nr:hypothetical protein TNCV_763521 [Trichonephila clavipes]
MMSVDHGNSSKHRPLLHRRNEIADPLRFSSVVQRCDSRKARYLYCKLDILGLLTFYRPVPRHIPWRHEALHCRAE